MGAAWLAPAHHQTVRRIEVEVDFWKGKYADPAKTRLRATVHPGHNEVPLKVVVSFSLIVVGLALTDVMAGDELM